MKASAVFALTLLFFLSACRRDEELPATNETLLIFDYSVDNLSIDSSFYRCDSVEVPIMQPLLNEASGLAVSRNRPELLWSHNDSGHPNRLFVINAAGQEFGYFTITGAGSRDYEDICIGPGPTTGVNYIYLGDIGDNLAQCNYIVIYRFPEPDLSNVQPGGTYAIDQNEVERFEFTYPNGPRDAETLMIDPLTQELFIVTKRDFRSLIYKTPQPLVSGTRSELTLLAQLPFNGIVAGDIQADGSQIVLKDFSKLYVWERLPNESVIDAMERQPQHLPYDLEPQGESIAIHPNGNQYFTISEQSGVVAPPVQAYKKYDE
jgi:hypothetical protein